ncbi:Phosphatidylinositol 4-kinase pik1alpha (PI4-kinase)(PtdIns-4-kinase) [Orbilia blumenaviensis]|uniref:1-phosphatidylinositol 4-kinase n=1 Tax=Orbilia blumenaviensis TaxID=1796055 RepID=A0AAV9VCI6_9PEZI
MSSRELLLRFFQSDHFNDDPFLAVAYLQRYPNQIGIHHYLCHKLRQFSYEQIEFYIPQLCHLLVSISDIESVALEELVIELCERNAHGALITFWLFQTHLHDLAKDPQSNAFKTCRRVYNKVQHIVFGSTQAGERDPIQNHVFPVTILAGLVLAGIAMPLLPAYAGPIAIAQARKPPRPELTISETPLPSPRLGRSKTVGATTSGSIRARRRRPESSKSTSKIELIRTEPTTPDTEQPKSGKSIPPPSPRRTSSASGSTRRQSFKPSSSTSASKNLEIVPVPANSTSMPDLRLPNEEPDLLSPPIIKKREHKSSKSRSKKAAELTEKQKVHLLRTNYFHSETQFLSALEGISNKLIPVPKPARLSALRAELALLNNDLPAEVDIPVILPCIAESDSKEGHLSSHHRIVRINPAEATVLNSAERVPYLIMVEVLLNDFDFDPNSKANQAIIASQHSDEGKSKRRIFDLSDATRVAEREERPADDTNADSVYEPASGDISNSPMVATYGFDDVTPRPSVEPNAIPKGPLSAVPRLSSGAATLSSVSSVVTPRSSGPDGRSESPVPRRSTPFSPGPGKTDQVELSALATHMRTAAHMLSQLEASSSKRPKDEVSAIKAKIIASMQALEEQSFFYEEPISTFESMMDAKAATEAAEALSVAEGSTTEKIRTEAGEARMENDSKTAGIARRGDKDDPSAATFGEEWRAKRERIRKSSPYGLYKNWDLLSVIVKTGGDLRQEMFACQLIQFCGRVWENASVDVWVRQMRILVTGESSGLIETITNGVSLHSLKRSLTLASMAAGKNPRGKFATLKDHWQKTFGETDSKPYKDALDAFTKSLAAYSIICYVLQVKDRHNGNILVDNEGHIIHIDFGFLLSNSPGSMGFEAAPFKLTYEYVELLGGAHSEQFTVFKTLCKKAFQALRKSADNLIMMVEIMGKESAMPCFGVGVVQVVGALRARFQLHLSQDEAEAFVENDLIAKSIGSYYTRMYDTFQYRTQGIY